MNLDEINDTELLFGDDSVAYAPPSIIVSDATVDIGMHPQLPILAVGLISGEVEIYEYGGGEIVKKPLVNDFSSWVFGRNKMYSENDVVVNQHNNNMRMHPTGCVSAMEFTDDGNYLVTASSDRTISVMDCVSARLVIHLSADQVTSGTAAKKGLNDMNKKNVGTAALTSGRAAGGKKAKKGASSSKTYSVTPNPHTFGISALNVCDENLIATGDDDGLIAVWDMRERKPVHVYHEHGNYVSQLCYFTDVHELISSSADTCLGCYDVRAGKVRDFSKCRKDEINCFAFINSTATSNRSFIPSIICGTPSGSLPMWKYGSWSRPYDAIEYHPRDCEAMVTFHGENTVFNHNLLLTGACDGLVRVLQMYPVRRNLCHLSARDYTYAHQGSSGAAGGLPGGGGTHNMGNFVVRRGRGDEGISKMRVSHDGNLLAVSGSDNIIDFVDIRFLNDEARLDELLGRADRRHMKALRKMEVEAEERQAAEARLLFGVDEKNEDDAVAASAGTVEHSPADSSDDESGQGTDSDAQSNAEEQHGVAKPEAAGGTGACKPGRDGSDSSDSEPTEEDKQQGMAIKERLIQLLRSRAAEKKRAKEEKELRDARRSEESSDEDNRPNRTRKSLGKKAPRDLDSSDDDDMYSSNSEPEEKASPSASSLSRPAHESARPAPGKNARVKRPGTETTGRPAGAHINGSEGPRVVGRPGPQTGSATEVTEHGATAANVPADPMEALRTARQERRERAAAARWLKEEKKKKINFAYEKRRRRVGGFFSDMLE